MPSSAARPPGAPPLVNMSWTGDGRGRTHGPGADAADQPVTADQPATAAADEVRASPPACCAKARLRPSSTAHEASRSQGHDRVAVEERRRRRGAGGCGVSSRSFSDSCDSRRDCTLRVPSRKL